MPSKEQIAELIVQAAFEVDNKNRPVCPLTQKTPTLNRCFGQHQLRMMRSDSACQGYCSAKLDDLKIQKYGGSST